MSKITAKCVSVQEVCGFLLFSKHISLKSDDCFLDRKLYGQSQASINTVICC